MKNLTDYIIITGASRGLGSELAYYFSGRVACQHLFFHHSAWGQCAVALFGGQRVVSAE